MKDNIMLSDDTTIDGSSVEPTIPTEMKITSWNVSLIVINVYDLSKIIFCSITFKKIF